MADLQKTIPPAKILDRLQGAPELPLAVRLLAGEVYSETTDAREMAAIVRADPVLAARLVEFANCADRPLGDRITTVDDALAGTPHKAALAAAVALAASDLFANAPALDRALYWRHAAAAAAAARYIARRTAYGSPDEAYLAAMLHDIGRLALAAAAGEDFHAITAAIAASRNPAVLTERETAGTDHAAVGEFLMRRWGLEERLCRAVGLHHAEALAALKDRPVASLAAVLQAADFLAWASGFGGLPCPPRLSATGVIERAIKGLDQHKVYGEMAGEIGRLSGLFGISLPGSGELRASLAMAAADLARAHSAASDADARLAAKIREVDALSSLRVRLRGLAERKDIKTALVEAARKGLGFDRALFLHVDEEAGRLRPEAAQGAASSAALPPEIPMPAEGSELARVIADARAALLSADPLLDTLGAREAVAAPVSAARRVIGLVVADNASSARPLGPADAAGLAVLADEVSAAFDNLTLAEHAQRMKTMAETDSLTGLHNRRYLMHLMQNEIDRAKRYSMPLSLVMMDLEGFKPFNDRYGHQVGDAVLKSFGRLLRKSCRTIDVPGRLGGDEFVVLLPETTLDASGVYVERLRKLLAGLDARLKERYHGCSLTMSIGVTSFNEASDDIDSFLHRADKAMYAAKQRGLSRVCAL